MDPSACACRTFSRSSLQAMRLDADLNQKATKIDQQYTGPATASFLCAAATWAKDMSHLHRRQTTIIWFAAVLPGTVSAFQAVSLALASPAAKDAVTFSSSAPLTLSCSNFLSAHRAKHHSRNVSDRKLSTQEGHLAKRAQTENHYEDKPRSFTADHCKSHMSSYTSGQRKLTKTLVHVRCLQGSRHIKCSPGLSPSIAGAFCSKLAIACALLS